MSQHLSATVSKAGLKCMSRRQYASSTYHLKNHDPTDYSKTVFVPKSKFPHRHDPKAELGIQEEGKFAHTYLEQDPSRKPYVVHDGPPFANGPIHIGHAINKILKDIAARYAMITGHKVEFITGWDCHGLPIELQILKMLEEQQRQSAYGGSLVLESAISPEHFRTKARSYAKSQIDLQMASFKRMGLLTDWNKRYTTDDPSYVANQLRAFSKLFEQKLVFKDLMPVSWSLTNRTTVADADIEYRPNHISKSAYILYEIVNPPFLTDMPGQPIYSLVWTTTPWTLLENQAIAFNKQESYCIMKATNSSPSETKYLLVALNSIHRVQNLLQRLGFRHELKTYVSGRSLVGLKYKSLLHTVKNFTTDSEQLVLPFLDADFVDGAKGTGLVHISPNYGQDDFNLIRANKIPVERGLIDQMGYFEPGAGQHLKGKHIFSEGVQEILNLLDQHQALLLTESTQHKYPYESRTNQPIIIRTSSQIFIDTSRIVPRVLKALESASIYPENRRNHLIQTLLSSPNWCISRQRLWGTPIPVLYSLDDPSQEKMITHPRLIEHFCKLLYKRRFMDYWWTLDNDELLPQELLNECKLPYKAENLVRGTDIFDVWSDSGLSWHTTTNSLEDKKSQCDLYLEGVDQIRGWFSASSLLSMALRGCLPTKRFFLHGFALDEYGYKMSKSKGNVINPVELFEAYGVDPVRLWAAKAAGDHHDVYVRTSDFKNSINEAIMKIRVTLKYLIGALADHDAVDIHLDHTKLHIFDQCFLDKLYRFASSIDEHYKKYRYDLVASTIANFITNNLSPIYITTIKDQLYCDAPDSSRRKSCLITLNLTYNILLRCLYPLTPHIVHEAGNYMRSAEPLNEWQDLAYKAAWKNDVLHGQFESIIKLRHVLGKLMGARFENMRDYDTALLISDKKVFKNMAKIADADPDLTSELFKTSTFIIGHNDKLEKPQEEIEVTDSSSKYNEKDVAKANEMDQDYSIKLISSWIKEHTDNLRVGGLVSMDSEAPFRFEICYKKSKNRKCVRCRRFSVLDCDENYNLCDRCKKSLQKLEMLN